MLALAATRAINSFYSGSATIADRSTLIARESVGPIFFLRRSFEDYSSDYSSADFSRITFPRRSEINLFRETLIVFS
jgi:hypothetical protein